MRRINGDDELLCGEPSLGTDPKCWYVVGHAGHCSWWNGSPDSKYGAVEVPWSYCWSSQTAFRRDDGDDNHYNPDVCHGPHRIMWAAK